MHIDYTYTHNETRAATGYFSCLPDARYSFDQLCRALEECPNDTFLHTALLEDVRTKPLEELHRLALKARVSRAYALASVLLELAQLEPSLLAVSKPLLDLDAALVATYSPLTLLRAAKRETDGWWSEHILANRTHLLPYPDRDECLAHAGLAYDELERLRSELVVQERTEGKSYDFLSSPKSPYSAEAQAKAREIAFSATDRLLEAGLLEGQELRHEASLAPVALLRNWRLSLTVRDGCVDYSLSGLATAYGRGFSLAQARASCIMEIVERASAYVSVEEKEGRAWITDRARPLELHRARPLELELSQTPFLDIRRLGYDGPDCQFRWLEAHDPLGGRHLVPAQMVLLFANFDEPELGFPASSTGLASGTSLAQAKLSALLEVLERDADATMPFAAGQCFLADSKNPGLCALFKDYQARGIHLFFRDLTHEFGVPVYQGCVRDEAGNSVVASACKLNGACAVLSALTETPWPYSPTNASPCPKKSELPKFDLPVRYLEDLPAIPSNGPEQALAEIERRLMARGKMPLYVDLTREDLSFPVVRAIVPGLSVSADPDPDFPPDKRLMARIIM